jgi:hypothetical protein
MSNTLQSLKGIITKDNIVASTATAGTFVVCSFMLLPVPTKTLEELTAFAFIGVLCYILLCGVALFKVGIVAWSLWDLYRILHGVLVIICAALYNATFILTHNGAHMVYWVVKLALMCTTMPLVSFSPPVPTNEPEQQAGRKHQ